MGGRGGEAGGVRKGEAGGGGETHIHIVPQFTCGSDPPAISWP